MTFWLPQCNFAKINWYFVIFSRKPIQSTYWNCSGISSYWWLGTQIYNFLLSCIIFDLSFKSTKLTIFHALVDFWKKCSIFDIFLSENLKVNKEQRVTFMVKIISGNIAAWLLSVSCVRIMLFQWGKVDIYFCIAYFLEKTRANP